MTAINADEQQRLAALHALQLLDTAADPYFDRLTRIAASLCHAPIAVISLIDDKRQWFKSRHGLAMQETDRDAAICLHTIQAGKPLVLNDLQSDPDFTSNPLVVEAPFLRAYAGVPLVTENNCAIGTIAVMDYRVRRWGQRCIDALSLLAAQVMTQMELKRQKDALQDALAERDTVHAALLRQADHLRDAQRIAQLGSWEMLLPSRRLNLSDEVYRIFGLPSASGEVPFDLFLQSVHASERNRVGNAVDAAILSGQPFQIFHRIVQPGGHVRHVQQRGQTRFLPDGKTILSGTVQDVTDEQRASERQKLLDACITRLNDIIMITDANPLDEPGPRIVFINRAFEDITGYRIPDIMGKSPRFLQGPLTQRMVLDRVRESLARNQDISVEVINYDKNGKPFWLEMDIAPVSVNGQDITHFVAVQRDITQRKEAERQIEQLAFYDPLTGLPNRRLLTDRLMHAIQRAKRHHHGGALLFLDLDNFKSLNDTMGHAKGDLLLQQVARCLEAAIRKSNTVARLGGDEFVILLDDLNVNPVDAANQAEHVAENVLTCFSRHFYIDGHEHHCTTSIGIALFGQENHGIEEILKRADLALYEAKAAGRNAVRFFDPHMQSMVNWRTLRERELRTALQRDEFVLHYQPQVDSEGKIGGVEALVRWRHPRLGLLYPVDFIAMAEENGLIVPLGLKVLEKACKQLAAWRKGGDPRQNRVAVNISARQFQHPDFLAQVTDLLKSTGVDPSGLILELTESAFLENVADAIEKMNSLKSLGCYLSLDDFGTGYSSLSYLKQLPLDELKIDQAFVRDIISNQSDAAITQTIVVLAQTLGLNVIAEGVETEEQRTFLFKQGCDLCQGYLISPPVPAETIS
jgi:diguanylate cyclase (GGDEF)-like protein/PAS domain S-box-containing protein